MIDMAHCNDCGWYLDECHCRRSTTERLQAAWTEARRLVVLRDSYETQLTAALEYVALLEERQNREMGVQL